MTKKVLVTGANGQLAKTIKKRYYKKAEGVDFIFLSKEELDITYKNQVEDIFNANNFNYCINCAAYTNVEQAEKTPEISFLINSEAVKNVALACKVSNTILIHISTDYVFDGEKQTPYTEDDKPNPINEYGRSKLLGEEHIQKILENYFIIRTSWLYSKEFGHNFYSTVLNAVNNNKQLTIDNTQKGCPTNTKNLADYILSIIEQGVSTFGIKHFCDEEEMTWYEFAKKILREKNLNTKLNLVKEGKYHTFAKRPRNSVLLNTK